MPRVTDEHREQMRRRIQQAALTCIGRKGFSAVSMADVITESGLSAGAVYLYYKSKSELFLDAGRSVMRVRIEELDALRGTEPVPSPAQALRIIVAGIPHPEFFPGLPVQVWGEAVGNPRLQATAREILAEVCEHITEYLTRWLHQARGLDEDVARERAVRQAPALMGLAQGYMIQTSIGGADARAGERYLAAVEDLLDLD